MADNTFSKELDKLKNLPPLPPKEQKIIDIFANAMVERALEDQAKGIIRKPSPEFLKKIQAL